MERGSITKWLLLGLAVFETVEWMRYHPHHAKHRPPDTGWHLPL